MVTFQRVDPSIIGALEARGMTQEAMRYVILADLNESGRFVDAVLALTEEGLFVLEGALRPATKSSAGEMIVRPSIRNSLRRPAQWIFEVGESRFYAFEEIESARILRAYTSAQLVLVLKDGKQVAAAGFTLGWAGAFEQFKERLVHLQKGEPSDDRGLDLARYCPQCGRRLMSKDRQRCPHCLNQGSLMKKLLALTGDYKKEIAVIFAALILSTAMTLIAPWFGSKMLYDQVLTQGGSRFGQVGAMVLLMLGIKLLSMLVTLFYGALISHIAPYMAHSLRVRILGAMERLPLGFFTSKQTGALMARVDMDADIIYWFFADTIPFMLSSVLTIIGILVVMLRIQPALSGMMLGVIALVFGGVWVMESIMRALFRKKQTAERSFRSLVTDSIGGQRVVKAFAREKEEVARFGVRNKRVARAERSIQTAGVTAFPLMGLTYDLGQMAMFGAGGWMIIMGQFTLGGLNLLISYSHMIINCLFFLMNAVRRYANTVNAAARMFEILEMPHAIADASDAVACPQIKGQIRFDKVRFEYEPGRPIIKNVSFELEAGKMLGIVGKTGAGKTTLINLLSRLYDPSEGDIYLDGVPLCKVRIADLRRQVAVVSQETHLFIGTIADNIRFASPEASMAEVVRAARIASAHDFILKLPEGYETMVGSGGANLSGGEKQRISIARAVLQNPAILILDEATAAMDTRTEKRIQQALEGLREGRTIVSIAHRLSTLRDADHLVVIDKGEVVESGGHDELIRKKGAYFELYRLQMAALEHIRMGEEPA